MSIFRKSYTKSLPAGAEIFQRNGQRHARWIDKAGHKKTARVTEGKDGSKRLLMKTATHTIRYRGTDGVIRDVSTGCRTRDGAHIVQSKLKQRVELVRAGILSPADDKVSQSAAQPIGDHVADYLRHLALEDSPAHISNVTRQMQRLLSDCEFKFLRDLQASPLEKWLTLRRREGMGPRTSNTYLTTLKSFATWCVNDSRLSVDPFSGVPKADEKSDLRRQRRALTEDEIQRLLTVARLRPVAEYGRETCKVIPKPEKVKRSNWLRRQLSFATIEEDAARGRAALANQPEYLSFLERRGKERVLIYKTLLTTGLRKGELASVTIGQVDLTGDRPSLALEAADEKNRQGSTIPLRKDLALEIQEFLNEVHGKDKIPKASLPLLIVPSSLSRILNRDYVAAGISKRDVRNRVVDVHALRHTFGSHLARAGVSLRTAQAAMRHSDPKLTANVYTDPQLLDVAAAVEALPSFTAKVSKTSGQTGERRAAG